MALGVSIEPLGTKHHDGVFAVAKTLPRWFTERGRSHLAVDLRHQKGLVALRGEQVVGFLSYYVAEAAAHIGWMGVRRSEHRGGVGRALIASLVDVLRAAGIESVLVDTLGDGVDYEPYALTRAFYRGVGFEDHACIKQDEPEWPERLTLRLSLSQGRCPGSGR